MVIPKYKLFITTGGVFIILNFIENIIHFNIGRSVETKDSFDVKLNLPTKSDFVKIVAIMIIFALLNATLVCYIDSCWK